MSRKAFKSFFLALLFLASLFLALLFLALLMHAADREDIFKEIDILVGMNHENVIFLKEYFEEGNKVYLITELLTGGELLDAVLERGSYNEADARLSFVQLLRGIQYLHSK